MLFAIGMRRLCELSLTLLTVVRRRATAVSDMLVDARRQPSRGALEFTQAESFVQNVDMSGARTTVTIATTTTST
eukprot:2612529-Amphidinium_carterae.1